MKRLLRPSIVCLVGEIMAVAAIVRGVAEFSGAVAWIVGGVLAVLALEFNEPKADRKPGCER